MLDLTLKFWLNYIRNSVCVLSFSLFVTNSGYHNSTEAFRISLYRDRMKELTDDGWVCCDFLAVNCIKNAGFCKSYIAWSHVVPCLSANVWSICKTICIDLKGEVAQCICNIRAERKPYWQWNRHRVVSTVSLVSGRTSRVMMEGISYQASPLLSLRPSEEDITSRSCEYQSGWILGPVLAWATMSKWEARSPGVLSSLILIQFER